MYALPVRGKRTAHMELYRDASHTGPEQHATVLRCYRSHKSPTGTGV